MKANIVVAIISTSCLFGCDSKSELAAKYNAAPPAPESPVSTNIVDIKRDIRLMCEELENAGESDEYCRLVRKVFASATNAPTASAAVEICDVWAHSLFAADFSALSYRKQAKVASGIRNIVDGFYLLIHAKKPSRDLLIAKEFEYKIKCLEWMRWQIRRLRPQHRVENPNVVLDIGVEDERSAWKSMYYGGMIEYEHRLQEVERMFPYKTRGVSSNIVYQLTTMIEDYMGRPIRSEKQLREDRRLNRKVEFFEKEDPHAAP